MPNHKLLVVVAVTLSTTSIAQAQLGWCKPVGCGEYDCAEPCQKVCNAECEWVKEKKTCWKVECDDVCIPPVAVPSIGQIFKSAIGLRRTVGELPRRPVAKEGCTSCGEVCNGSCDSMSYHCKGGRIRTIRKLKSHSEEYERLVVKWDVKSTDFGCTKGCTTEVIGMTPPQPMPTAHAPQQPIFGNSVTRPASVLPPPTLRFEAAEGRTVPPDPGLVPANPVPPPVLQPNPQQYQSTTTPWGAGRPAVNPASSGHTR